MTRRISISREEWELLGNAPMAASAAVALASPGGGAREASALITAWRESVQLFPDSELMQMIIIGLDPEERAARERPSEHRERRPQPTLDEIVAEAVELCQQAISLIRETGTRQDLADYQTFVMHIVTRVASATNEHGFIGFGGDAISRAERSVIEEIAMALRSQS